MSAAPPVDIEIEQACLANILVTGYLIERVAPILRPEHFADPLHVEIYAAMLAIRDAGSVPSPQNVSLALSGIDAALLSPVDTIRTYVGRLATSGMLPSNTKSYAEAIIDLWLKRCLLEVAGSIQDMVAAGASEPAVAMLHGLENQIAAIPRSISEQSTRHQYASVGPILQRIEIAQKGQEDIGAIKTGFYDVDRMMRLRPGNLVVLAGRPAMGKSALAGAIAMHAADQGVKSIPVGILSLEMTNEDWTQRNLAMLTGIPVERQMEGAYISDYEFQRLYEAGERLRGIPIHIDDTAGLNIGGVRDKAHNMVKRHKCGLIIVDHIQIIAGDRRSANTNRLSDMTDITGMLKQLAKELNVPVLALSQLSRKLEERDNKRPMLSDLRESGSIEQDADAVAFVFQPAYYLAKDVPSKGPREKDELFNARYASWEAALAAAQGKTEIIVDKNRHGKTGISTLIFNGEKQTFDNYSARY